MKNYLNGTLEKTTDYIGNAIYEDDALALFGTAEGRVTKNPEDGALEYEYALSDHTGNTRVVVSATDKEDTYTATMEDAAFAQEDQVFYNLVRRVNYPASANIPDNMAMWTDSSNPIGTGIALAVYPGDELDLSAKALYTNGTDLNTTTTNSGVFASEVSKAFGGLNGGTEAEQATFDLFDALNTALLTPGGTNNGSLSAYLNYLVFDKDYVLNTAKSGFIGMPTGVDQLHNLTVPTIEIDEPGFIYVYVSNESNSSHKVYFDDLTVTNKQGKVIQSTDYYPFGLATEDSWTRVYSTPNKFLYNSGTELNENTRYYETPYRNYDASIGRFMAVDPLASRFSSWTPYMYAYNDPVFFNDPTGLFGSWSQFWNAVNTLWNMAGEDGGASWSGGTGYVSYGYDEAIKKHNQQREGSTSRVGFKTKWKYRNGNGRKRINTSSKDYNPSAIASAYLDGINPFSDIDGDPFNGGFEEGEGNPDEINILFQKVIKEEAKNQAIKEYVDDAVDHRRPIRGVKIKNGKYNYPEYFGPERTFNVHDYVDFGSSKHVWGTKDFNMNGKNIKVHFAAERVDRSVSFVNYVDDDGIGSSAGVHWMKNGPTLALYNVHKGVIAFAVFDTQTQLDTWYYGQLKEYIKIYKNKLSQKGY